MACSILPNPEIERDVNTYLDLWAQEPASTLDEPSLGPLFQQLSNFELLASSLEAERALAEDGNQTKRQTVLSEQLVKQSLIMNDKNDKITQIILQHMDYFPREPNENFQITGQVQPLSVGIWGNLTRNPRHKLIEFNDLNMSFTLPKPLSLSAVAIRMSFNASPNCGVAFENQASGPRMAYVGGILYFDLMELPDLPKQVDEWTMRTIASPSGAIRHVDYPFAKISAEAADEEGNNVQDDTIWPTTVSFQIPPGCSIHQESAQIMWWDASQGNWRKEGITDDEIDGESGKIKFRTIHFAPTALVQVIGLM